MVVRTDVFIIPMHSFTYNPTIRYVQTAKPGESSGESEHVAVLPVVPHEKEQSRTTAEVCTGLQLPSQPEDGEGTPCEGGGRIPHGVEQSRGTAETHVRDLVHVRIGRSRLRFVSCSLITSTNT